ncbi:MAG: hypothetical protein ACUVTQ_02975 [Desulfotomaculales bacterium]
MGGLERRVEELEVRVAALERMASERAEHEELEALKDELSRPVERTPEEVAKALSIVAKGRVGYEAAERLWNVLNDVRLVRLVRVG